MQWITPTSTDLYDARANTLLQAATTQALASGQADPTSDVIAKVVEEIRGAIGFSGKYQVSATANTIPPNLKDMAVLKIVRKLIQRFDAGAMTGGSMLTPADQQDDRVYEARLNMIRQGQYPVDLPDDPLSVAPSTPSGRVEFIQGDTRRWTTCGTQNLL